MDMAKLQDILVSEIRLLPIQAEMFLYITTGGKKTIRQISAKFGLPESESLKISRSLVDAGSLIELSGPEFEAMHPRFTAVNMYRRMCERENIPFQRNKLVDGIGAILERPYDDARTK